MIDMARNTILRKAAAWSRALASVEKKNVLPSALRWRNRLAANKAAALYSAHLRKPIVRATDGARK